MRIQWELLIPAALMLLLPLPLRWGQSDLDSHKRHAERPTIRGVARAWQNWADLVRAALGALLLNSAFLVTHPTPENLQQVDAIKAGIYGIALVLQMFRYDEEWCVYAPHFYLSGLAPLLGGLIPGGFAVAFAWLFVLGAGDVRWLLPVMAGALAVAGFTLEHPTPWLVITLTLLVLPFLLSFLFRQLPLHLCRPVRPKTSSLAITEDTNPSRQPTRE